MAQALLNDARARIEQGWCQNADAQNAAGEAVKPWSEEARASSLLGALVAASRRDSNGHFDTERLIRAAVAAGSATDAVSLQEWNDDPSRTRDEVLSALVRAGERLLPGAGY